MGAQNSAIGASSVAQLLLQTGTANSSIQINLNDNNGSPTATIVLGSATLSLAMPNNTFIATRPAGDSTTYLANTAFIANGASSKTLCKAWANFDGTLTGTNAPTNGYNIASITRNGTGDYTATFTSALTNANYTVSLIWSATGQLSGGSAFQNTSGVTVISASSFRFSLCNSATAALNDGKLVMFQVFGG